MPQPGILAVDPDHGRFLEFTAVLDQILGPILQTLAGISLTDHFDTLARSDPDDIIGRRLSDNEEFDGAPASTHVKRTAQESFDPEAFILRWSVPWPMHRMKA